MNNLKKTNKEKKIKAWIVLNHKGKVSGCVPHVFDEKYKLAMIARNSGLNSTFELKKFALLYKKTLVPKGKVIPCEITYKI